MMAHNRISLTAIVVLGASLMGHSEALQSAVECNASMTDLNFGNYDSQLAGATTATATLDWECSNDNAFNEANVTLCLSIGPGSDSGQTAPRQMNDGSGAPLEFQLFKDSSHTLVWGSVNTPASPDPVSRSFTIPLAPFGATQSVTGSETLYGRILAGQAGQSPGAYNSLFTANDAMLSFEFIESSSGSGSPPPSCGTSNNGSFPFQAFVNVGSACTIEASELVFPNVGTLDSAVTATNTITITCSSNLPYHVGINNGLNSTGNTRRMTNGNSHINYELYADSNRSQRWGNTVQTDTVPGNGTGQKQDYNVFGVVPAQGTPSSGTYSDTLTVTVTY